VHHANLLGNIVRSGLLFSLWGLGPLVCAPEGQDDAARRQQIQTLQGELDAAAQAAEDKGSLAYLSNVPLARLKLEKATLRLNDRWRGARWEKDWEREIEAAKAALERLRRNEVAHLDHEPEPGEIYIERAYQARTDGSPQPYFVVVPEGYDPARAWPLVIFLHGYVTETSKLDPWIPDDEKLELARREGFLFVATHGRRNSDFLGVGEVDTWQVLEEMRRFYHVDEDRIYLFGVSMGGYGGWGMCLHYPDLFAAVALVAAQSDFFVFEGRNRETTPRYQAWALALNNPIDLAENALNVPVFFQHGKYDPIVDPRHSQRMAQRLEALGYGFRYLEDPSPRGHYIYWDLPCYERAFRWFKARQVEADDPAQEPFRRRRTPRRVVYKTYSLKYSRSHWVQIDELARWGQPARIEAEAGEGNKIQVTTENVTRYTLDLPAALISRERPLTVTTNGAESFRGPVPAAGRVSIELPGALPPPQPGELRKTAALCGPAQEAFNTPFLVTYGTGGGDAARLRSLAERFQQEWYAFAEGWVVLKPDTEVTAEEQASHNLVIFGEPENHALLAPVADRLPIRIARRRYGLAGKVFTGENLGLVMVYPNPQYPERLLLIYSGLYWGTDRDINHKYDLLPDFILFNDQYAAEGSGILGHVNHHLAAGFFNQRWEIDETLIDWE